jgi:hypothetical protein
MHTRCCGGSALPRKESSQSMRGMEFFGRGFFENLAVLKCKVPSKKTGVQKQEYFWRLTSWMVGPLSASLKANFLISSRIVKEESKVPMKEMKLKFRPKERLYVHLFLNRICNRRDRHVYSNSSFGL